MLLLSRDIINANTDEMKTQKFYVSSMNYLNLNKNQLVEKICLKKDYEKWTCLRKKI